MSRVRFGALTVVLLMAGCDRTAPPQHTAQSAPRAAEAAVPVDVPVETSVEVVHVASRLNLSVPFAVHMPAFEPENAEIDAPAVVAEEITDRLSDEAHRAARFARWEGYLNEDPATLLRSPSSLRERRRDGHYLVAEFDHRYRHLDRHRNRFELQQLPFAGERVDLQNTNRDLRTTFVAPPPPDLRIERRLASGSDPLDLAFRMAGSDRAMREDATTSATVQASTDAPD